MTELQTVDVGSQKLAVKCRASAQLGTFFGEAWRKRNVERPVKDAGVRKRSASVDQTGGVARGGRDPRSKDGGPAGINRDTLLRT